MTLKLHRPLPLPIHLIKTERDQTIKVWLESLEIVLFHFILSCLFSQYVLSEVPGRI